MERTPTPTARRKSSLRAIRAAGAFAVAAAALSAVTAVTGCTHLLQTSAEDLPDRMPFQEFAFDRPQGSEWYMRDTLDPPNIVEFTRRGDASEAQIRVVAVRPPGVVQNIDQLTEWAQDLPDEDKVIRAEPGHGATCVRYHGRSALTVNYARQAANYADRMITDEDSLECIDPHTPDIIVRFIVTQRSAAGGTPEGNRQADAFLSSVAFRQ
jgi:hypothetical protein